MNENDRTTETETTTAGRFAPIPLSEFVEAEVEYRRWAVEGIWPEGASGLIAGPPKAGKSTVSLELAISLATRTPFLGVETFPTLTPPAAVTYVQAENSDKRVRRDLDHILEARGLGEMEPIVNHYDPAGPDLGARFRPTWPGAIEPGDWEPDLQVLSNPGLDLMRPEDQAWLRTHAADRDYLFFDPLYLLASANPNDTGDMMRLLGFLADVRDSCGCALILTHQLTDKSRSGSAASRLLGSTFLHGWYESAIFADRAKEGLFRFHCDHLREMAVEREFAVRGLGVGSWARIEAAEDRRDSEGRAAPRVAEKAARVERMKELEANGEERTTAEIAEALGVVPRSVKRYRAELREAEGVTEVTVTGDDRPSLP